MNMQEKIKEIISSEISPMLAQHGGSIEFVEFSDGVVKVKLVGACATCEHAQATLKNLVEQILKEKFKEVKSVENV